MTTNRVVSVSRIIPAEANIIFNLLANPAEHARLDGSGSVTKLAHGPHRLYLGAKFSMKMKLGFKYTTKNKVVVFEENRAIAWHHIAQFVWRYDLVPVEGGTQVTESFDYSKPWGRLIEKRGFPERNRLAMQSTLERLEHIVTS